VMVVGEICNALGLKNVITLQSRMEDVSGKYDFIVSRAVTRLPDFISWVRRKIDPLSKHSLKNGILYLKGGDMAEELLSVRYPVDIYDIYSFFQEDFFKTKKIVYVRIQN
ncbi:MAG: class I SAM-dependent methyltransferase, partial [Bacteroidetes bacterium]|nr:class I SAM-dependent methyltransferase [Bacteroidota bacterium]